jgi:hypothetical protein
MSKKAQEDEKDTESHREKKGLYFDLFNNPYSDLATSWLEKLKSKNHN